MTVHGRRRRARPLRQLTPPAARRVEVPPRRAHVGRRITLEPGGLLAPTCRPLGKRLRRRGPDVAGRGPDDLRVAGLLEHVGAPPDDPGHAEGRREHARVAARRASSRHRHRTRRWHASSRPGFSSARVCSTVVLDAARPGPRAGRPSPAARPLEQLRAGVAGAIDRVPEAHDALTAPRPAAGPRPRPGRATRSRRGPRGRGSAPRRASARRRSRGPPTRQAARSAPVLAMTRAVKVEALKPWSIVATR